MSIINNNLIIQADIEDNHLEYYSNHLNLTHPNYFSQSIYSYWISSSHNTYLPYGQIFDPCNECYYRLILLIYFGGCVEIDTYGISKNHDDVIINHLPTNLKEINLRQILKIVISSLKMKELRKIVSGPIILTFDNKKLNKKWQHDIFWKIIEEELLTTDHFKYVAIITDNYDLTTIPINSISNQILLRWSENKSCPNNNSDIDVGTNLCAPSIKNSYSKINSRWIHLLKGHNDLSRSIVTDKKGHLINNDTRSISIPIQYKYRKDNYNLVVNLQRNILRMFPHFSYTMSQNYNNMIYFRDGVQITALNLQYISDSWFLNKSVFMPRTGVPCTPSETENYNNENNKQCRAGWKNGENNDPLAYRLKPLWLLGLIPNPGLYKLHIKILKCSKILENGSLIDVSNEYTQSKILYGLTLDQKKNGLNSYIVFNSIDVTVPYFVLHIIKTSKFMKQSVYTTGIEIPWNLEQSIKKLTVDVYKIMKTITGTFNKVELSNNCNESKIFNTNKQLRIELEYNWTFENENNEMIQYNQSIKQLRESSKYNSISIPYFLNNLDILKDFQTDLANLLVNNPAKIDISLPNEVEVEGSYEDQMSKLVKTATPVDTNLITED